MYRLTVQYDTPVDPEAFDRQYFDGHVPLCRPLPGLRRVSFCKPRAIDDSRVPYLVAELDFDDAEALTAALRSPQGAIVAQDADKLPAKRVMFVGEVTHD